MSMLTVSFRYSVSQEQFGAENGPEVAHRIASTPGLAWKLWLHDPDAQECVGVYRFEDEASAAAYAEGAAVAHLRSAPGYHDVAVRRWSVLEEQSAITRAPGLAATTPAPDPEAMAGAG